MLKCYRIENERGEGPYRGIACEEWETHSHNYDETNPGPYSDFPHEAWAEIPGYKKRACVFGFMTLAQLRKWFDDVEREHLRYLGYNIVRLEAYEIVASSDLQCAFVSSKNYLPTVAK